MAKLDSTFKADVDNIPIRFGKYQGETAAEVAQHDPEYIVWLYHAVQNAPVSRALAIDCEQGLEEEPGPDEGDRFSIY